MDKYLIIALGILVILLILPIIVAKNKSKEYIEEYIIFLNKNGIRVSLEDENLIRYLVKERYKNTINGVVFALIIGIFSFIPFALIISFIIIIITFISSFRKFQRSCPYCHNTVKLSTERCHKCTKYISNWWVGKPILEQFHRG